MEENRVPRRSGAGCYGGKGGGNRYGFSGTRRECKGKGLLARHNLSVKREKGGLKGKVKKLAKKKVTYGQTIQKNRKGVGEDLLLPLWGVFHCSVKQKGEA